MQEENIIAVIPARGGSKRIPGKNIINFCGKPLLAWSIEQVKASSKISSLYVSTDNEEIVSVAKQYGAKVINRPKEIAGDEATSEEALKHAINEIRKENSSKIDYVVCLQATSPLRETGDIDNAIETIQRENADSLFSAAEIGDFLIWREREGGSLESLNYDYKNRKRGQEFEKQLVENGSFYVLRPEVLFKYNNRLGGKITVSLMEFWKSFEIDEPDDLKFVEELFKLKGLDKTYE